jgi:hypothetical protein
MYNVDSRLPGTARFSLILLLAISPLLAQVDVSAKLLGRVTDPSGAVVSAAQIVATNQETGVEYKATADDQGTFAFAVIVPSADRMLRMLSSLNFRSLALAARLMPSEKGMSKSEASIATAPAE